MSKRVLNVFFVILMLQKNTFWTCFSKNTFKTRFYKGFRELQKNPDIYEFFPIQSCRFQNFLGLRIFVFRFLLKKRFKKMSNLFFKLISRQCMFHGNSAVKNKCYSLWNLFFTGTLPWKLNITARGIYFSRKICREK